MTDQSNPSPRRGFRGLLVALVAASALGAFAIGAAAQTGSDSSSSSGSSSTTTPSDTPSYVQDGGGTDRPNREDCPEPGSGGPGGGSGSGSGYDAQSQT
jgi:hypothetical protein